MNNEWHWLKDKQPPPHTDILILIYNRYRDEFEPEDIQTIWDNSDFIAVSIRDYAPDYTFVAWMIAPEMPSLETIRHHLSSQETPHE